MSTILVKTVGNLINSLSVIAPKYASKKAIQLFATPRKGRYTEAQKALLDSAFFEVLDVKNHNIATYRWPGKNKTILLVHGWESNASRWSYLLDDLQAQDYNIIALDAPGHGRSSGKQFTAILYAEFINYVVKKHQPEIIIGHSVGGMATIYSLHHYDLPSVSKIVTLGSPAHYEGVFNRYISLLGYNKIVANGINTIVVERYDKPVDYFNTAQYTSTFKTIEGLIIHDRNDQIIPFEDGELYAQKFKNSDFIPTSGLGHGLRDAKLTSKIINFINR